MPKLVVCLQGQPFGLSLRRTHQLSRLAEYYQYAVELDMGFIGSVGIRTWVENGAACGDIAVDPWLCGPGGGLRIGLAALLADLVIGIPPTGRTASTVELSVRWTAEAPTCGRVKSIGRVLKWGQRLMFGDSALTDETNAVRGWAAATFVSGDIGKSSDLNTSPRHWGGPSEVYASVEEALHSEVLAPGVVEMPMRSEVTNWEGGTIQGGIQACLAELAAEQAIPGMYRVTDLAIRYLNRAKSGPVRATATVLPGEDRVRTVHVELRDDGGDGRLVSHVTAGVQAVTS
jgi:acyl-coenzyme A thioesterase PaaI-like protein